MKDMRFLILALLVLLIGCEKDSDNTISKKKVLSDNPLKSPQDLMVDKMVMAYASKSTTAGFSLALISPSAVVQYNYGETRIGNKTLPNNKTLYEIGSLTKTFIAPSLLHWMDQNNIELSSPIAEYLPLEVRANLSLNNSPVTFKHLLAHLSGLPRIPSDLPNTLDPYKGYDSTKVYSYLKKNKLLRAPGTPPKSEDDLSNYYSNLAYGLAGLTLERNMHKPLKTILYENFFNKEGEGILGKFAMPNSTLGDIEGVVNRAFPHNITNNAQYWHFSGLAAAGGIKSCLVDMIEYAKGQLSSENSNNVIGACHIPVVSINNRDYFGLGWEYYYTSSGKRLMVKDGGTGGFTAFIAFDKTSGKAMVALFNNSADNEPATPFVNLMETFFK